MLDGMILLDVLSDRCDLLIVCAAFVSLFCSIISVRCKTAVHARGPADWAGCSLDVFEPD